jgi:hypothetical protein
MSLFDHLVGAGEQRLALVRLVFLFDRLFYRAARPRVFAHPKRLLFN